MCGKPNIRSIKFHVNFFQWSWTMQLEYIKKCRKITCDRVKSNVEKWNLIGGIQFKHIKNCPLFM